MSDPFDVIPFEVSLPNCKTRSYSWTRAGYQRELEEIRIRVLWKCLQRCAITHNTGNELMVSTGTYLGIDVAIKEVLPSTEYDVAKYFEREWRLMK